MTDKPKPGQDPAQEPDDPSEAGETRDLLLTFVPAIVVAFAINMVLESNGWSSRRALGVSIAVGIVLALILQQAVARARRR
jgi:hypothetical protein